MSLSEGALISAENITAAGACNSSDGNGNGNGTGTTCFSEHEAPLFYRHVALTVTYVMLNSLILLIGVGGNALIVILFCRQQRMRTDTNVFIMNLAISDVLICCVSPGTLINTLLMDRQWTLGLFLCKTLPGVITIAVFSSSFTMTAVALNRFLVARSNKHLLNWQRWSLITSLWLISVLFSLPIVLHSEVIKVSHFSSAITSDNDM